MNIEHIHHPSHSPVLSGHFRDSHSAMLSVVDHAITVCLYTTTAETVPVDVRVEDNAGIEHHTQHVGVSSALMCLKFSDLRDEGASIWLTLGAGGEQIMSREPESSGIHFEIFNDN